MTIDRALEIIRDYKALDKEARMFRYPTSIESLEIYCELLKLAGYEWGVKYTIPNHFRVVHKYYLTNSAKKYKQNENELYVVWDNGNIGTYQFVRDDNAYRKVQDEWMEFKDILLSYKPLDYDPLNCQMIFNIENGKRLMVDYKSICDATKAKMELKIAESEKDDIKAQIEKLQKRLEEMGEQNDR